MGPAARRRLQRAAIAIALLALAVGCGMLALRSGATERWAALALVQAIEVATGERASVGSLRFYPVRKRLQVVGLMVLARDGGETILAVRELQASLGRDGFKPVLDELTLMEPVLQLHLDEDGLREFRGAVKTGGRRPTPWRRLRVSDARLALHLPQGALRAQGINLVPLEKPHRYDLSVSELSLKQGRLQQQLRDLRLSGMTLDMRRLFLPELALEAPLLSLAGELYLIHGGPLRGRIWLGSDLQAWDEILAPRRAMEGQLDLDLRLGGTTGQPRVSGSFALSPWVLTQVRPGESLADGAQGRSFGFGAMTGSWELADELRELRVTGLMDDWAGGELELDLSCALQEGTVTARIVGHQLQLAQALRRLSIAPTAWADLVMDLESDLQGELRPLSLSGPVRFDISDFHVNNGPVVQRTSPVLAIPHGLLAGQLEISKTQVRANFEELRVPRGRGSADVTMGLSPKGPLDVQLDLWRADLADFRPLGGLKLRGRGQLSLHLHGAFRELQLQGAAAVRGLSVFGVPFADEVKLRAQCPDMRTLSMPGFEARRGRTRYAGNLEILFGPELTLDTQVLVRGGYLSDLVSMFVDLPGVEAKVDGTLELSGPPDRLDGSAEIDFGDVELVGERFPAGHASARMDQGRFTLRGLSLARRGDAETLLLRGSVGAGYATNMELITDGMRLETLDALQRSAFPLEGALHLRSRILGRLMEPELDGRLFLSDMRSHGVAVPDSALDFISEGSVVQLNGALLGDAVALRGQADWRTAAYDLRFAMRELPLQLLRPMSAGGYPLLAQADGQVSVRGAGSEPPDVEAELGRVSVTWEQHHLENAEPWRFVRRGQHMDLQGVSLAGEGSQFSLEGGHRAETGLSLKGRGQLDLAWLRLLGPEVLRAGGTADLSLEMDGSLDAPDVRLSAGLRDGLLRTTWFPHTIEGLQGEVVFSPAGYRLKKLRGSLGGGDVQLDGRIHATDWLPVSYQLDGKLGQVRLKYIESLPPIVGDAALHFDGPADALVLSGKIDVHEVVFAERIDWEAWVLEIREERLGAAAPEEKSKIFSMDIEVDADGTGRIRNNVGNARLSADLRVVGDTARPGVLGKVWAEEGGRVYLKEREFDITRAEVHFIDPYSFDPELDLLLETDVRSRVRDYHLFYRVTGPFSAWNTSASSDPALSQADINWLLLFGATREELEEYGGLEGALAWESMDLLGHELGLGSELVQRLGGEIFQRIDIVTGATAGSSRNISSEPRVVIEKDLGQPWDLTLTGESNMVQYGDFFASVEKRIARRLFMTAYWSSIEYDRSLDIGGAYGTEFKLRWELD